MQDHQNQETMVLTLQQAPTTMFLDADDLLAPTYIDSCIANLERDKNLNIVYTEVNILCKKGKWNLPNFSIPNFRSKLYSNFSCDTKRSL
jgi:hypothetical protein